MYKEHPLFETPENKGSKVWRYMDFTKFVSLLEKQSLYFARADKFDDPFEGSYPIFNIQNRPSIYKDLSEEVLESLSNTNKEMREFFFMNCWHLNEYESAAMWKIYLSNNQGIAIQSSFESLRKSFDKCTEKDVFIGKVKYIDYKKDWMPEGNYFYPLIHKRISFSYEKEIRCIIPEFPKSKRIDLNITNFTTHLFIPVYVDILIEKIYIAPTATEWFRDLVETMIKEKYGIDIEVKKSSLSEDPVF